MDEWTPWIEEAQGEGRREGESSVEPRANMHARPSVLEGQVGAEKAKSRNKPNRKENNLDYCVDHER